METLLPLLAVVLAACGASGGDAARAVVRDSAGIRIVENVFPDSARVAWWRVEPVPEVDIGGDDAGEAYSLYQVGGAARLSDGRLVVANGGSAEVRWYAADGTHQRTTGRRGGGPGEFQRPGKVLALPGDTVVVADAFGARATVLDAGGEYLHDFRLGEAAPGTGLVGRLGDGTLIASRSAIGVQRDISEGLQRPEQLLVALGPSGELRDTLFPVPGTERFVRVNRRGGQIESMQLIVPPFARNTVFAIDADEVFVGTQDAAEVLVYDGTGELVRIVRTGAPARPITPALLDAWIERQIEGAPPEIREASRQTMKELATAEVIPPYDQIIADEAQNLWIADFEHRLTPGATWSVFDPLGELVARIRLPARMRVFQIGADFVLGVERDELDVERLRLYWLIKSRGG